MDEIIIYGTGPFAEQAKYMFEEDGRNVVAFTEGKEFKTKEFLFDLPVYEFETLDEHFSQNTCKIFVAIGYTKLNRLREEVCQEVVIRGFSLFSFISSKANVSKTAVVGDNVLIVEGVYVGYLASIGNGVIIHGNSYIAHNCIVHDNVFLSASVVLGGNSIVKRNSFVGMNSTVRDGIIIQERNILGSATNVSKTTEPDSVYIGNPARKMNKKSYEVNI